MLDQKVTQTFPTDAPLKSICVLAFAALGGVPVVAGLAATARSCSGAQDGIAGRPMPVGTYITFGKFRTMHLGDITKNQEFELMCPINGRRRAGARLREARRHRRARGGSRNGEARRRGEPGWPSFRGCQRRSPETRSLGWDSDPASNRGFRFARALPEKTSVLIRARLGRSVSLTQ